MKFKTLKGDSQGRVSLGPEYANKEVTIAISETDDQQQMQIMREPLIYLNREVILQYARDWADQIEEMFEDVRTTFDINTDPTQTDFMIALIADPSDVSEEEMEQIIRGFERELRTLKHSFEQNESLSVISDEKIEEKRSEFNDDPKRYAEYVVGPLNISDLPAGYLSDADPLGGHLLTGD